MAEFDSRMTIAQRFIALIGQIVNSIKSGVT